jgi:hypothetical protein
VAVRGHYGSARRCPTAHTRLPYASECLVSFFLGVLASGRRERLPVNIWLISPYGPIPGEGWRDDRFNIIGDVLAAAGHNVLWWTPNFSHHFKPFRSEGWDARLLSPRFRVRLVPTTPYSRNVGLGRLRYAAVFARRVYRRAFRRPAGRPLLSTVPATTTSPPARNCFGRRRSFVCPYSHDI